MSLTRGIYRIAQAIKWTGRVLGGIGAMAICYSFLTSPLHQMDGKENLALLAITIVLVAITEGIAWVVEGFGSE